VIEDAASGPPADARLRALMVRYQDGHLDGFDEFYALVSPGVRRFLGSRVRDTARLEELVQETFLQLHRARHTYDPAHPVMPWLMAIARHTWLMDVRTCARRPHAAAAIDETVAPAIRGVAEQLPERDEVRRALARIGAAGRIPAVLHHVWGYSFVEIARRTGVNQATAKLRSSRAMRALRRLLHTERNAR
jgi:RNA polymerase sigma-70 factor, ECF subfamily